MNTALGEAIVVAVKNYDHGKDALLWTLRDLAARKTEANAVIILLHIVDKIFHSGRLISVANADDNAVNMHVYDNVIPFLEILQEMCDDRKVSTSLQIVKSVKKSEAIIETVETLRAVKLILAGKINDNKPGTITKCTAVRKPPKGCSIYVIHGQRVVRSLTSTESYLLSPSSVFFLHEQSSTGSSAGWQTNANETSSNEVGNQSNSLHDASSPASRRNRWKKRAEERRESGSMDFSNREMTVGSVEKSLSERRKGREKAIKTERRVGKEKEYREPESQKRKDGLIFYNEKRMGTPEHPMASLNIMGSPLRQKMLQNVTSPGRNFGRMPRSPYRGDPFEENHLHVRQKSGVNTPDNRPNQHIPPYESKHSSSSDSSFDRVIDKGIDRETGRGGTQRRVDRRTERAEERKIRGKTKKPEAEVADRFPPTVVKKPVFELPTAPLPMVLPEILNKEQSKFRRFFVLELQEAISAYFPNHLLGEGSYGIVYRGRLCNSQVAIKQLKNTNLNQALDEINREVEIQNRIDHPNLVRLLGFCLEAKCLVYDYMPNGNLDDRLKCLNNFLPLHWSERIRIALEIALGLQHLHSRKPPIVHRDIKPANVLLDENLTAKLGDVGLARIMTDLPPGNSHIIHNSFIAGTKHYMDPEYLCARRCFLGPKSDVYSFGIVLLQLLVGDPPNLQRIDSALDQDELQEILDPKAGSWPHDVAMDLANLGIWCSELDRKYRPNLETEVIPALYEILETADLEMNSTKSKSGFKEKKMELGCLGNGNERSMKAESHENYFTQLNDTIDMERPKSRELGGMNDKRVGSVEKSARENGNYLQEVNKKSGASIRDRRKQYADNYEYTNDSDTMPRSTFCCWFA